MVPRLENPIQVLGDFSLEAQKPEEVAAVFKCCTKELLSRKPIHQRCAPRGAKILTQKEAKNVSHHVTCLVRMTVGSSENRKEITNTDLNVAVHGEL